MLCNTKYEVISYNLVNNLTLLLETYQADLSRCKLCNGYRNEVGNLVHNEDCYYDALVKSARKLLREYK